jgi:hypothetical protein
MDYDILFILAKFQKFCLNKCCFDTNFVGMFLYIANLMDKLDTQRFGATFSLGVHAVRKDSYIEQCAGKDLQTLQLWEGVISRFKLDKCALRRYACKTYSTCTA